MRDYRTMECQHNNHDKPLSEFHNYWNLSFYSLIRPQQYELPVLEKNKTR